VLNWFIPRIAHSILESETSEEHGSKQVMVASSTTQREEREQLSSMSTDRLNRLEGSSKHDDIEIIEISEKAAKALVVERE
jgi:hypothetical protein